MVVHDLRSPAVVVSAALDAMHAAADGLPDATLELLDLAADGMAHIDRLVVDLLTLTRIDCSTFTFAIRELDLAAVVRRAVDDVRLATGRTVELEGHGSPVPVVADEGRQRQILDNLITNAVNYSPRDRPVEVSIAVQDDVACVRVRDRGPGIDPADRERLFEPFTRLSEGHAGGTGLGLTLAKALVEGQGGTIRVDDRDEGGASFSYTVPLAVASA